MSPDEFAEARFDALDRCSRTFVQEKGIPLRVARALVKDGQIAWTSKGYLLTEKGILDLDVARRARRIRLGFSTLNSLSKEAAAAHNYVWLRQLDTIREGLQAVIQEADLIRAAQRDRG